MESKEIKQCPKCLTMKHFEGDVCARCSTTKPAEWQEEERNKFYEAVAKNGIYANDGDPEFPYYSIEKEVIECHISRMSQAIEKNDEKWRTILNSGRKMYELGKKEGKMR